MTGSRPPLHGRKLADRRVHIDRPHSPYFRYSGPGQLVAKQAASQPTTGTGRLLARFKAATLGRPLANEEEIGERLPKVKALPIFSSDAISSSAYATDEILKVLILAGAVALTLSIWIAAAIALMLTIVAFSYRQVCRAYPSGGGAYVVARENLGQWAGLVAAAALMIDYVMTVAVSTASAIANLQAAFPAIGDYRVELAALSVALVTAANLRGLRESGNIFAMPTYLFVSMALLAIGVGLVNIFLGQAHPLPAPAHAFAPGTEAVGLFLLLHAFAGGSVALTGVEAIANGVPAFKPPESKNAANTLVIMALLLGTIFIGLTFVGMQYGVRATDDLGAPVLGQVSAAVFGNGSVLFVVLQASAALILFLAANTSFNAFPRLAAILSQDGFMPRQFSFRGDRLAFSWGIVVLACVAIGMLVLFKADQHALIPLYSVGVFVCFTLSQAGMVRHWRSERSSGWMWRSAVNGFGACLTAVVFLVVATVKFRDGAWLVLVFIPILLGMLLFVSHQYASSARQLALRSGQTIPRPRRDSRVIIPIPGVNRAVVQALNVARTMGRDLRALYVADDPEEVESIRARWSEAVPDVPLVVVESPYRALIGPIVAYLDVLDRSWPTDREAPITFVVIPEYVARNWWERILYNQSAKRLKTALLGRPHTVVVDVPYRRDEVNAFERTSNPPEPGPARESAPGHSDAVSPEVRPR